ncbi:hypothetical protein LCGC14_2690200, partial [marine sediment metagenome]
MLTRMIGRLDECWAAVLGCSVEQLRDGERHVMTVPQSTSGVQRPWPLREDSIALLAREEGWVLSVPAALQQRAIDLCIGKPFADIAAEGDSQAEQWFARGARDDEKQQMRGAGAYPTLARLAEGLPVRCWSHYFHWYCDSATWRGGELDAHVREL